MFRHTPGANLHRGVHFYLGCANILAAIDDFKYHNGKIELLAVENVQ